MLDGDHRGLPPGFADRRAGWLSQVDATVSPFSGAIRWMYAPLGSSSGSASQRAHEESQRACPCVECQRRPLYPLDGHVRSLPPDRTVQQVPRTTDRVTREVITKRSRPRTQTAGRHVAAVNHPHLCDLEDDTDPSRGYASEVIRRGQECGPRKKRVYLIKRPRCSPRFGSVTLLVRKPSQTAAGGKGDCPQTKAALTGSADERKSSSLKHFAENEDGVVGAVQGGECPENDILLSCVSTRDRLQNEQDDGSGDSEKFPTTSTVAAAEEGAAVAVEGEKDLLHKQPAACEGCGVQVSGDVALREVFEAGNVTRHQLETEKQQLEPSQLLDRDVDDVRASSSEPEGDVQISGRYVPVLGSSELVPGSDELFQGNESVQERDNSIPRSNSLHKSDKLVHESDEIVPGSELVHGSDISVPGNEQQTPGEGELDRTFCEFVNTALCFSTPLSRWDLEENYSPSLGEHSSVWSIPVSPDAVACNGDERDRTGDLRQEKQDRCNGWNFVESQRILSTEDTPTHEHHFGELELSPTSGSTFSDSVNSEGGEANSTLSCDSLATFSVKNKGKSTQFCSGEESKHSSDENHDKQSPLLGDFSGPTSDLTPEEGAKKTLATMFGSKKGKYIFGLIKSPLTEDSDPAKEDSSSSLCTLIPRNPNSGSSTCARQKSSLNGRPASVDKGRGKVQNKEMYSRFFLDSEAGNHTNPPRTPRGGSLLVDESAQKNRSKTVQRIRSVDGSCVSRTPTPLFSASCVTSDIVSGACTGPTSSGSRQNVSNSSFSERETTEQEICLLSQDLEKSPIPIGKRRDKYGGMKAVKGRLAKKTKKIIHAVKSYDLCSEGGTGARHFQSSGLPYEPDSESDSTDSTTSDDEYPAGFKCKGDNSQSTDGKRRSPISQRDPRSKGHQVSSVEEVLRSDHSAKTTTSVSTTSPPPTQPIVDKKMLELQSLQRKKELSYLVDFIWGDSQESVSKGQRVETTDAAAHAIKPNRGWQQILSDRYAELDHMTAEKEWRRELVTATSETTKTNITAPDKGLTAQSAKKDRQEKSQILLADAAVVKKEEEDDLTPISAKRASVSVISYNFVEPVKRPDAGASVDESSATGESLLPRSREAGNSPSSAGNFSGSSGPNDAPVVAARSPYETALAQVHREGEDSQLTVVTPLAEPLQVSTSTPSSDEVTVTESESEASLSPLASAVGDFKESAIYVFPRNVLSKPDYEFIFSDRPQLARFGRAQSAPGKPPCTIMESRTLSAPSRSMSLHAASSATLKMPSSRIYDVPPRRLPLKFPVESNRPGSVLFHDLARATATDRPISSSFSSVCKQQKQQQPQHLHQSIPHDENPYVNDADDVSQPTVGRSSVWDESQKNAETRRSRLQRTYNTCSLAEGQKMDSQSSSRESSRHPFDVEAVVTKDHRVMEGMVEEAVYANSVAVYFPQKATQNSRTTLSTAPQKDIFNETSANVSGNSDHRAQTRGQTAQKGITQESSRESDQRKKEKGKRESKKPCLGRKGSKEPSVEDGWVDRGEEAGHGERMMRKPVRAGQMLDQDTSEAATVMGVASPDVRNRGAERRDSKDGWSEQDETLKLNPEPSLPVEVTVRSKTSTHTHQYHSDSGKDTDYEDVHLGGQRTTNNPVSPAPVVHARLADAESSPASETRYVTKQTKYNEYSNIIRIDSTRLKAAHAKSLSTAALFTATNRSSTLSAGRSPLRNAISLEDGLISVERKKKKKKTRRKPDKDGSPRKYRRHFSFQKLLNMFRKKKKKKRTEKIPEAQEETTGVAEVRTSNKFFNMRKILKMMKKPKAEQTVVVSSSQDTNCIRPIGRLLQLNADGTQLVELIRPQDENLGIVLTTGSDEENGIFVSGFTDNSLEKHLAGVLNVGDQIIKVNERFIRATSLDCIHNMIMGQQRIKLLTFPMQGK